jgi:hypothetical protein
MHLLRRHGKCALQNSTGAGNQERVAEDEQELAHLCVPSLSSVSLVRLEHYLDQSARVLSVFTDRVPTGPSSLC